MDHNRTPNIRGGTHSSTRGETIAAGASRRGWSLPALLRHFVPVLLLLAALAPCRPAWCASGFSSIASNFNGTAIPGGSYVWFDAHVSVSGRGNNPATVQFTGQTLTSPAFNVNVPNATVIFDPAVSSATTSFSGGAWVTRVPVNYNGNVFISGLPLLVPAGGFPGGVKPVTWSGTFSTSPASLSLSWQWGAAVYTQFSSDPNALGVKPIEGSANNPYPNAHHAGTPEAFLSYVIGGGRGGGGSNWTGSWSGTASLGPSTDTTSLDLVKTASATCVEAGANVTYTYKVTNTGTTTVSNIQVTDDKLGSIGAIASLAPGASQTFTKSTTLQVTTTNTATASVASTVFDTATATVTVVHPELTLEKTASADHIVPGQSVTYTYKVTNTGTDTITNISVDDDKLGHIGDIASLAPGASKTFTKASGPLYATTTNTVTAVGFAVCGQRSVTAYDTATVEVCLAITGSVFCREKDGSKGEPVVGATVRLLFGSTLVNSTSTNMQGAFSFNSDSQGNPLVEGRSYTIEISKPEHVTLTVGPYTYSCDNGVNVGELLLEPLAINYLVHEVFCGVVLFGTRQSFVNRQQNDSMGNPIVIHAADLSNASSPYISPDRSRSYQYEGTIPYFGPQHYGGPGEPTMWVIIEQPLMTENEWHDCSLTNQVQLWNPTTGVFDIKFLFNQPFTGPGTAHCYQLTAPTLIPPDSTATWTAPILVWIGGGPAPPLPPAGDVPPGWMVQSQFTFHVPPATDFTVIVNGSYKNVCQDVFDFHIHPDGTTLPAD